MAREAPRWTITADLNERRSEIPATLERLGIGVELEVLEAGDYVVSAEVLVERKAVPDLHTAVVKGHFWSQIGKLRAASRYPFLFVEGLHLDNGPLTPKGIRGVCLATIEQGIRVVRTSSRYDTALWLHRLAARCQTRPAQRDRPRYTQRRKPPPSEAREALLAAVPGISTAHARALLARFGTVAGVIAAGQEKWLEVQGIGPERASALANALSGQAQP